VIHRDIKPENLLVSRNGTLKLCDFGFARTLAGAGARYTDYVATRWYRGPELLTGDTQYGKPVDIWAIGCMLPEMASGAPLFPGESDIDQLFHIMRCFGNLPPRLMEVFKSNPLFIGIKLPDNIAVSETLEKRFPNWSEEQLSFMKNCLKYEPEQRCTCGELMQHPYFTEDGFVAWFEEELKQMLERDAQDFKMRQKKFRKNKNGRADNDHRVAPPAQAPPASIKMDYHPAPIPPYNPPPQPTPPPRHDAMPSSLMPTSQQLGEMPTVDEGMWDRHAQGQLEPLPTGGNHGHAELGPPPLDNTERRPSTRESHSTVVKSSEFGTDSGEFLLPNLNRPTTPRAQRLVAFPHLASALEDQGAAPMPQSRLWGNQTGPMPMGKGSRHLEMPSMPQLGHGPGRKLDGIGHNLPQLQEGQPFAAPDLPERSVQPHIHVPAAPPSRGVAGGGKKKTGSSAYDSNNPYGKPAGKLKKQSSKGMHGCSQGGGGSCSQMGVVGQAQSLSGLAAAYAAPSSGAPSSCAPHFGESSSHFGPPPRTPQDASCSASSDLPGVHAGASSFGFGPPPMHGAKLQSSHNYGGGQYAKYGKRY